MNPIPPKIDGATVVCYSPIDARHRHTGNCRQIVNGQLQGPASGVAICQYDGEQSAYLFNCDESWHTITDTWHRDLKEAKQQAEFEYEGVSQTWIDSTMAK